MAITADEYSKYSADMMKIIAREQKVNRKQKELENTFDRIQTQAHLGFFECIFNHFEFQETIDALRQLGYSVEQVENSANSFAWKVKWADY